MNFDWFNGIPVAITISDLNGNILEMNDAAAAVFEKSGGKALIGKALADCHNENSIIIMDQLLSGKQTNVYTIEKNGRKKLIFQCPWMKEGKVAGLIEFSMVVPFEMKHFIRG